MSRHPDGLRAVSGVPRTPSRALRPGVARVRVGFCRGLGGLVTDPRSPGRALLSGGVEREDARFCVSAPSVSLVALIRALATFSGAHKSTVNRRERWFGHLPEVLGSAGRYRSAQSGTAGPGGPGWAGEPEPCT